jgi:excisionase family DNA binding protein
MTMLTTTPSRGAAGGGGFDGGDAPNRVRGIVETARLLDLSPSTLRRLISAGSIRAVRLSTRRRGISDRDREAFIERNAT